MRRPGAVLLVSCYELGHQPYNLASPTAALRAAGFDPLAIDTSVQDLPDEAVVRAKLVAISVPMHTAMRLGEHVARRVRGLNPTAHITFFGLYAWLNADYLFGASEASGDSHARLADSVIGGEFEQPLLNLAQGLERFGPNMAGAEPPRGVGFPERRADPYIGRISYLVPHREGLPPLASYGGLLRDDEVLTAGYTEATRGCKHTCLHCPITPVYRGRFFAVPRDIVLADIRSQVAAGAKHITFGDPDFLNGPTHALRVARALHSEFPDVTFDATIKVEHILKHREVFPELRELGCIFVVSAVESLSDAVLKHLDKGHTKADVATALDIMASAGIPLRASLVAFTPWTTLEDYLELIDFVEARQLFDCIDPVHYAIRLPDSARFRAAGRQDLHRLAGGA